MSLLTVEDVQEQFPSIADRMERDTLSEGRVERWISHAEGLVNSKISARYDVATLVATDPPPAVLLMLYWGFFDYFAEMETYTPTNSGGDVPWVYARYDRLMRFLNDVASGAVQMLDEDGASVAPSAEMLEAIRSNHTTKNQIFSQKESWDMTVDDNYSDEPTA